MSEMKPPYSTIDEDERERARLAAQWLTAGLTPTLYKTLPIKWQEHGLKAEVRLQTKDEHRIYANTLIGDLLSVYSRMREDDNFIAWLKSKMKDHRITLDDGTTVYVPPTHPNIEYFIETLPAGIKFMVELMKSRDDGLLYPSVAIRHWQEMPSETDDGRPISSSGSYWKCDALVSSRQQAGIVTTALYKHEPFHYELWSLFPFGVNTGPHILDHKPDHNQCLHGKKGHYTGIKEEDVREFACAYTLDYYQIHKSNHRSVEVLSCGHHQGHYANWYTRMKFSAKNDQVTLLISSTHQGLEVFAHKYDEENMHA